jgi:uncharacterized protein (TIGR03437 family)
LPSPIVYTSAGQVTAIVPFSVAGRVSTKIEVEYRGLRSNAVQFRVADSAPGIFTLDSSGQGAIVNQDGTINSTQNGAAPGSIVSLYATGGGVTDVAVADGSITQDVLAKPVLPVSVQIGGVAAEVQYAGAAPGLPAGMMQVNVRVPDAVARGARVPVVLTVGQASSQSGVFLATQ